MPMVEFVLLVSRNLGSNDSTIVSLLPAATEIVSALGATELLVGRSHELWPHNILSLPVLTAPKIESASSCEIDQAIKNSDSEALFSLNESLLRELSLTLFSPNLHVAFVPSMLERSQYCCVALATTWWPP